VNWYLERESEAIARARRSQPFVYKAAAAALGAVEATPLVGGLVRRSLA
jgi:hypothetical protein